MTPTPTPQPPLVISEEAKIWSRYNHHPEVAPMVNRFQAAINQATEKLTKENEAMAGLYKLASDVAADRYQQIQTLTTRIHELEAEVERLKPKPGTGNYHEQ